MFTLLEITFDSLLICISSLFMRKEEEEVYEGYNRHIVGQHSWLLFSLQLFKICLLIDYVENPRLVKRLQCFYFNWISSHKNVNSMWLLYICIYEQLKVKAMIHSLKVDERDPWWLYKINTYEYSMYARHLLIYVDNSSLLTMTKSLRAVIWSGLWWILGNKKKNHVTMAIKNWPVKCFQEKKYTTKFLNYFFT